MNKRLTKKEFLEKYKELITEEQINSLSFDYFNQKYPNRQRLPKEDLKFLFIDLNLSKREIALLTDCSEDKVKSSIYHYKLKKSLENSIETQKRTCIEKYGVYCSAKAEQTKQKTKQTCMERYGVDNPFKLKEFQDKNKQTCLNKYGYEHCSQNPKIREKISQTYYKSTKEKIKTTCLKRYNATSFWGSDHMDWNKAVRKSKETCLKRYGVDNIGKLPDTVKKTKRTNNEKYGADYFLLTKEGQEKTKNTNLEKYGVENVSQSNKIKDKIKKTCIERYGTSNIMSLPEFQEKANITRKKNNPHKKDSKEESIIFNKLITKFKTVKCQHFDRYRYPFRCDFYVPELDLFIEYQGYQGHGGHPFNPENEKDLQLVCFWKNKYEEINFKGKKKQQYKDYIKTWTIRDVKKRQTAKENNLNWIEFFNMKEFNDWFNSL